VSPTNIPKLRKRVGDNTNTGSNIKKVLMGGFDRLEINVWRLGFG
jgi:hypothetical protein